MDDKENSTVGDALMTVVRVACKDPGGFCIFLFIVVTFVSFAWHGN
jgi:hypothetical protein